LKIAKSFATEFYERFLITLPKEQIFNMVEHHCYYKLPFIKQAKFFANELDSETQELIDIDITEFLQNYMNYHYSNKGNRAIWMNNDSDFCYCLTEFLKILINLEKGGKIIISYQNHCLQRTLNKEMIYFEEMLVFKEDSENQTLKENKKIIEALLRENKQLFEISNHEIMISKPEFLNILSKMPLISYGLANALKNAEESPIKEKKQGIIVQIFIEKNEILRLRIYENQDKNEENGKNSNEIKIEEV